MYAHYWDFTYGMLLKNDVSEMRKQNCSLLHCSLLLLDTVMTIFGFCFLLLTCACPVNTHTGESKLPNDEWTPDYWVWNAQFMIKTEKFENQQTFLRTEARKWYQFIYMWLDSTRMFVRFISRHSILDLFVWMFHNSLHRYGLTICDTDNWF